MVVLAVDSQMLREVIYPLCEQSDLNFGGAGIGFAALVLLDNLCFPLYREHSALGPSSAFFFALAEA